MQQSPISLDLELSVALGVTARAGMIAIMKEPKMELLSTVVVGALLRLTENPDDSAAWMEIESARAATEDDDEDLGLAVEARDLEELRNLAEQWGAGTKHLPACDRGVLKRAMKAFRKTLKVTILAHESSLGGGPLSGGRESQIVGIQPPQRYPAPVWQELARQGRLVANHGGTYELPPGE